MNHQFSTWQYISNGLSAAMISLIMVTPSTEAAGFERDTFNKSASKVVLNIANKIDSFFSGERADEETQKSRVRVYVDMEQDEIDGSNASLRIRARLVLPNTNNRWNFELNGSDDDDELDSQDKDQDTETNDRERSLGLNYTKWQESGKQLNLGIGVRFRDSSTVLYGKFRHRIFFSGDKWLPRLSNEIRQYGDTGFEYLGRLDFDRIISDSRFLRLRTEIKWHENKDTDEDDFLCNDGYCFNQFFSLFQRFNNPNHAIAYDWYNYFVTEPENQFDESQLRIRYRHRLKWDWLHYEIRPSVRFIKDEDYDPRWSILLRIEGVFGHNPTSKIQFN